MSLLRVPPAFSLLSLCLVLGAIGCGHGSLTPPLAAPETAVGAPGEKDPSAASAPSAGTPPKSQVASSQPTSTVAPPAPSSETETQEPVSPILLRNPFQPPTVTVRTLTPHQSQTADIRLLGIAKRDTQRYAILENADELNKAAVGDLVRDWEVTRIGDTQVTLRRGLEEIMLQLN